jgi:hypothetical protein
MTISMGEERGLPDPLTGIQPGLIRSPFLGLGRQLRRVTAVSQKCLNLPNPD